MLSLMMKEGEYLTIGEDIVVQVFPDSKSRVRLAIKAPKDKTILRGDVRERAGVRRPDGLVGPMAAEQPKKGTNSISSG